MFRKLFSKLLYPIQGEISIMMDDIDEITQKLCYVKSSLLSVNLLDDRALTKMNEIEKGLSDNQETLKELLNIQYEQIFSDAIVFSINLITVALTIWHVMLRMGVNDL